MDSRAEQDLINATDWFSQLVPQQFRRGSNAMNPIDWTFPLPTSSHSIQWSIPIKFHGSKILSIIFYYIRYPRAQGIGGGEGGNKCPVSVQVGPRQLWFTRSSPFILRDAGEIFPFPSKAANSFRLITGVARNLKARAQLIGAATVSTRKQPLHKGMGGKEEGFARNRGAFSDVTTEEVSSYR